jgi:ATP adenylyltransferase
MAPEEQRGTTAPAGANLDRLWTPWRAPYINNPTGTGGPGCFLCRLPLDDPANDATNLVLYRTEEASLLLNRFPYNSGHLLAAPRAHTGDFTQLTLDQLSDLFQLCQRAMKALSEEYHPSGFNVGLNLGATAGAGIPDHLHVHLVPRWAGDTNFMPVLAETKVLPETLDQTYARLRPYFLR